MLASEEDEGSQRYGCPSQAVILFFYELLFLSRNPTHGWNVIDANEQGQSALKL